MCVQFSSTYHLFIYACPLTCLKQQIKRRLQYQYSKTQSQKTTFEIGSSDPMAILMSKITGNSLQRPRQKTAYNLWGPEHRHLIDPIFKERVREGNVPATQQAALHSSLYKELFEELPEDQRKEVGGKS